MRDTSLEMRRAKAFHHLNSSYFESALIFCTVLFYIPPFSTPFTRIPNLLLTFSYLVHPYPESALNLFVSHLPASRIYSYSLRISITRIPNLLLSLRISFTRTPHLLLLPSHIVHSHPSSASKLYPVQKSSKMLE